MMVQKWARQPASECLERFSRTAPLCNSSANEIASVSAKRLCGSCAPTASPRFCWPVEATRDLRLLEYCILSILSTIDQSQESRRWQAAAFIMRNSSSRASTMAIPARSAVPATPPILNKEFDRPITSSPLDKLFLSRSYLFIASKNQVPAIEFEEITYLIVQF